MDTDRLANALNELQEAVDDGKGYETQLQDKMDEMEEAKDELDRCLTEVEEALAAFDKIDVDALVSALDTASELLGGG